MQGKIINGFELKSSLGRGGMAEVWYAENEIGKPAAVKILNEDLSHNAQIVDRFRNEAVVMVKLDHPNIRQVYGYGTIDDRSCIVMEYLDGNDLKALMKQGRHFTEDELVKWWNQLVEALNYTHAQGIVHRDIKPSNIFIDKKADVKLLDFGIAKVRESISMTQTGSMMGTLIYMSPEQVQDSKHLDYRTDVYSLAVTFVHLLTGKAPYDNTTSNDYAIRKGIVEEELDLSTLPVSWRGFLKPYLAKEPADRPVLRAFEVLPNLPKQEIPDIDEGTIADTEASHSKAPENVLSNAKSHDKPSTKTSRNTAPPSKGAGGIKTPHSVSPSTESSHSKGAEGIKNTLSSTSSDTSDKKPKGKYYAIALLSFSIAAFVCTLIFGFSSSDFLTRHYAAVFDVLMYAFLAAIALSIVGFIRPSWLGLQSRKEVAKTYLLSLLFCLLAVMGVSNHKPDAEGDNLQTEDYPVQSDLEYDPIHTLKEEYAKWDELTEEAKADLNMKAWNRFAEIDAKKAEMIAAGEFKEMAEMTEEQKAKFEKINAEMKFAWENFANMTVDEQKDLIFRRFEIYGQYGF